jgi:nucleoside-diphosphate-sugar epimerase
MMVLEIAELICELTGSRSKIEHHPLPPDDPTRRRPDITKARQLLGWQPQVQAPEGIADTIEYYRQRIMPARRHTRTRVA